MDFMTMPGYINKKFQYIKKIVWQNFSNMKLRDLTSVEFIVACLSTNNVVIRLREILSTDKFFSECSTYALWECALCNIDF